MTTEQVELTAEKRDLLGKKAKQLRREGWVPAVMYGRTFEPVSLQFKARELGRVLDEVGGSQLLGIKIEGAKGVETALVRDVQRDVIRGDLLHVDLYRVDMAETLTTEIPLAFVGEPSEDALSEGILLYGLSALEVECLPSDLVDAIEVDLSVLVEIDQSLHVRDLAIPAGIEVLTDVDEVIAHLVRMKEEEIIEEEVEELEPLLEGEEVEVISEARPEEEMEEAEE